MSSSGSINLGSASGINTKELIEAILAPQQEEIAKIEEEVEINKGKIQTWQDIASQMQSFGSVLDQLRSSSTDSIFSKKTATVGDKTVFTAVAESTAISGSYEIEVTQLAQAQAVASTTQWENSDILGADFNFYLNGTLISLTSAMTLDQIISTINGASYDGDDKTVNATKVNVGTIASPSYKLILQGENAAQNISIANDVAGTAISQVNNPVAYNYLVSNSGFVPGAGSQTLSLLTDTNQTLSYTNQVQAKQPALVELFPSGTIPLQITSSSNQIEHIPGVAITLVDQGTTHLVVDTDVTDIKESLIEFVSSYNDMRGLLERVREVKIDEDENFGPFFADSLLRRLSSEIRQLTTGGVQNGDSEDLEGSLTVSAVNGANSIDVTGFTNNGQKISAGTQLTIEGATYTVAAETQAVAGNTVTITFSETLSGDVGANDDVFARMYTLEDIGIGVKTSGVTGVEGILGVLDEGKLEKMLSGSLSTVQMILQRSGDQSVDTGVAERLFDWVDKQTAVSFQFDANRSITDVKVPSLQKNNENLEKQIDKIKDRIKSKEALLQQQFARMESAFSRAQSSTQALSGLASSGS